MAELARQKCVPCSGKEPAATDAGIQEYKKDLPDWSIVERDGERRLERTFKFKTFREALDFTNRVGEIAEQQDHHPSLLTEYGKVTVTWWTHKIHGLHKNDFIMAARTDELYR
jgi:4a-hydroxytetrahydrobiopterin dehydratase